MANKIVIANKTALIAKYTATGQAAVQSALQVMIAADRGRGTVTTLVYVDDVVQMAYLNAPVVTTAASAAQNKAAVDGVVSATNPVYILLLDAGDVIPFQPLTNLTGDGDPNVPSDLPYACSAPYSLDPNTFTAPSRMVGRIPGVAGGTTPAALIRAIVSPASMRPGAPSAYRNYWAVSMQSKNRITSVLLNAVYGSAAALTTSPASGPAWAPAQYQCMSQIFALHGGSSYPNWLGDDGGLPPQQPTAVQSTSLVGATPLGAIIGAQCCYGAQLYAPGASPTLPICNDFMANGAAAFFGCTVIGYSYRNSSAPGLGPSDLFNQYWMQQALSNQALGAAFLKARLAYVAAQRGTPNAVALKMLSGFVFYGDPATVPLSGPLIDALGGPDQAAVGPGSVALTSLLHLHIADPNHEKILLAALNAYARNAVISMRTFAYTHATPVPNAPHRAYLIIARRADSQTIDTFIAVEADVTAHGLGPVHISESS